MVKIMEGNPQSFVVIISIRYTQYLGRSIIRVVVATLNTLSLMSKTCNESQPVNRRPQLMKLWQVTRGVLYCFSYEIKDKAWSKFSIHYHHMIFLLEEAKLLLLSTIHKALSSSSASDIHNTEGRSIIRVVVATLNSDSSTSQSLKIKTIHLLRNHKVSPVNI